VTKNLFRLSTASLELVLAAALWGFGFVATIWGLVAWAPVPLLFWRFVIGTIAGVLIAAVFARPSRKELLWQLRASFLPALFLAVMILLQTWGMLYTTATKSGFITILYIVLVPLLETVVARKRIPIQLWLCIAISLVGVYLIVDPSWDENFNIGDFLTLLCAFGAALQIITVDRVSGRVENAFVFNVFQSAWAALMLLPAIPFQPGHLLVSSPPISAWVGLLSLALGSTLIAFYLQVRAQKVLSSTVSSLFFLLESPFALLFAYLFLNERLGAQQGVGAVLIMISAFMATLPGKIKN